MEVGAPPSFLRARGLRPHHRERTGGLHDRHLTVKYHLRRDRGHRNPVGGGSGPKRSDLGKRGGHVELLGTERRHDFARGARDSRQKRDGDDHGCRRSGLRVGQPLGHAAGHHAGKGIRGRPARACRRAPSRVSRGSGPRSARKSRHRCAGRVPDHRGRWNPDPRPNTDGHAGAGLYHLDPRCGRRRGAGRSEFPQF